MSCNMQRPSCQIKVKSGHRTNKQKQSPVERVGVERLSKGKGEGCLFVCLQGKECGGREVERMKKNKGWIVMALDGKSCVVISLMPLS